MHLPPQTGVFDFPMILICADLRELRAVVPWRVHCVCVCEVLTEDTWQDEKRFKVTTGATLGGMGTMRFVRFRWFCEPGMPKPFQIISIETRPKESTCPHGQVVRLMALTLPEGLASDHGGNECFQYCIRWTHVNDIMEHLV